MRRNEHLNAFVAAAIFCALFESFFLLNKLPRYEAEPGFPMPFELTTVGPVRVGAVLGHHGASFVRLSPDQGTRSFRDDDLARAIEKPLRSQLRLLPLKAAVEYIGYTLLLFGMVVGVRLLWRRCRRSITRALGVAGTISIVVLALEAPLLVRYDTTMWSTWVGPGALSYSYSQQHVTMIPGVAVAHRTVLESLNLGPVLALRRWQQFLTNRDAWAVGAQTLAGVVKQAVIFYSSLAFVIAFGVSAVARVFEKESARGPAN